MPKKYLVSLIQACFEEVMRISRAFFQRWRPMDLIAEGGDVCDLSASITAAVRSDGSWPDRATIGVQSAALRSLYGNEGQSGRRCVQPQRLTARFNIDDAAKSGGPMIQRPWKFTRMA